MNKKIDFGEEYDTSHSRASQRYHDKFGIASLLLRYKVVNSSKEAAWWSKLIMLGIILISFIVVVWLQSSSNQRNAIPEDAYFDPAIHNTDDEPL